MVRIVSWLEKYIDKVYVNDDNKCQEENDRNKQKLVSKLIE